MRQAISENLVKNIILILILIPGYLWIYNSFKPSAELFTGSVEGSLLVGSMLVAVSILAVAACFGNFAFTYKETKTNISSRLLAHITTGFLMLVIGFSLEMTSVIVRLFVGQFPPLDLSLILIYIASVLYDFWDLKRAGT